MGNIFNISNIFHLCRSEEDEPQPGKTTGSNQKATASRNAKSSPADDDSESESSDDEDDDDESDDSSSSDADEGKTDAEIRKEKAWQRIMVGLSSQANSMLNI